MALTAVGCCALGACAGEQGVQVESLRFQKISGKEEYRVMGMGTVSSLDIVIPATYRGLPVTEIGANAFTNECYIENCTIPDSVTSIGNSAFEYCSSLTSVYYKGTAEEWNAVEIVYNNSKLTDATRYYYSKTMQSGCWYYDENGVPTLW